jgi:hypothetical protein
LQERFVMAEAKRVHFEIPPKGEIDLASHLKDFAYLTVDQYQGENLYFLKKNRLVRISQGKIFMTDGIRHIKDFTVHLKDGVSAQKEFNSVVSCILS